MIDATARLAAVRRTVGTRLDGPDASRLVRLVVDVGAPATRVWEACTDAEALASWFLPVQGDLRAGGHYQLLDNAGGIIERCDPPHAFAVTWEFDGNDSVVTVALEPAAAGTRLTLEHRCDRDDPTWALYGPGATGIGWDLTLLGLHLHVDGGPGAGPADAAAWVQGEDGLAFTERLGRAWLRADLAGGADDGAARAAAGRAIEAYTGRTPELD